MALKVKTEMLTVPLCISSVKAYTLLVLTYIDAEPNNMNEPRGYGHTIISPLEARLPRRRLESKAFNTPFWAYQNRDNNRFCDNLLWRLHEGEQRTGRILLGAWYVIGFPTTSMTITPSPEKD